MIAFGRLALISAFLLASPAGAFASPAFADAPPAYEGRAAADSPPAPSEAAPAPAPVEKSASERIDELFDRLARTGDEDEAAGIVHALENEWLKSGSDASDLLMARALQAFAAEDYVLALQLLDTVVATDPQWAEGWNKRATVRFYAGDVKGSAADVAEVLKRNPRHVGALGGLGMILEQAGRNEDALKVFERAEAIAPHYKPIEESVERLKAEVAGQSL